MLPEPRLTVIIPTFQRAPVLARTLAALCENQQGELPAWEVIVVDDGSGDDTPALLAELGRRYEQLQALRQPNRKQGAARNHGLRHARGELLVFLGDDIIPEPDFLAAHWAAFRDSGEADNHAAIGHTDWHPEIPLTPFLRWANEDGLQFGFRIIADPETVPFNFFYTSNLAIHRALYERHGGFDESFSEYGWEDIELGYRYQTRGGMRLRYRPAARALHHHRLTLRGFCRRQYRVGYSAELFHRLHPELADFLHRRPVPAALGYLRPGLDLAAGLLERADRLGVNINPLGHRLLQGYYLLGMGAAQRAGPPRA